MAAAVWIAPDSAPLVISLMLAAAITDVVNRITPFPAVNDLHTPFDRGAHLVSADGRSALIRFEVEGDGADGTEAAAQRLSRVLWNDPASGVMRHADAGYPDAIACAREHGLRLPMLEAFDQPDTLNSCALRPVSTFAPQALILMNGPFAQEKGKALALRLARDAARLRRRGGRGGRGARNRAARGDLAAAPQPPGAGHTDSAGPAESLSAAAGEGPISESPSADAGQDAPGTKQAAPVATLRRPKGAAIALIVEATASARP